MTREIKFRAWVPKPVNYGYTDKKEGGVMFYQDDQYLGSFLRRANTIASNKEHDSYVGPEEMLLLQFTGLKDKNGKEIYEGDVVCVFDEAVIPITDEGQGPIEACNHLVAVEMRNGVWGFEIPKSDDGETGWYGLHYWNEEISSDGYEAIGNIYENKDLLPSNLGSDIC